MPDAGLPTSVKGWIIGTIAALAGLIAGFLTIKAAQKIV